MQPAASGIATRILPTVARHKAATTTRLLGPKTTVFRLASASLSSSSSPTTTTASTENDENFGFYYHIEASNAARDDATQLTVSGPDVDGILASMTVALAVQGCSLVELHAAKSVDCSSVSLREDDQQIKDVFAVVNRNTGQRFEDEELEGLANALLESLKTPMNTLSVTGANKVLKKMDGNLKETKESLTDQITVIPSTA